MYNESEMNDGSPTTVLLRLRVKYKTYWRTKSNWYWFWRLLQEIFELFGCLVGWHKDPIKWELLQISTICLNWIYKLEGRDSE